MTIFGADLVRAASTYMGIAILVTAVSIYAVGVASTAADHPGGPLPQDFQTTRLRATCPRPS